VRARKTWSGIFHCPICQIEEEFLEDDSLECRECGERMIPGPLDEDADRRLWDDVGPAFAEAVERQEARAYYRETARCPYCGEIGVFHDPDRGGEPA
jgi:DNA-directed RNA polymerase subunit RPC12/RpoP